MRIFYSDESGCGPRDQRSEYTVVTGFMVNAGFDGCDVATTQWTRIHRRVYDIFQDARRRQLLYEGELKGRHLLRIIRKDQVPGRADEARKLFADLVHAVKLEDAVVFCGRVHNEGWDRFKARHQVGVAGSMADVEDWPPFQWAFSDCLDNVEEYLHTVLPREHVQWLHDAPGPNEPAIHASLRRTREFWDWDHPDARHSEVARILSPVGYGDSRESLMLQVADVFCTIVADYLSGGPLSALYPDLRVMEPDWPPHFEDEMTPVHHESD